MTASRARPVRAPRLRLHERAAAGTSARMLRREGIRGDPRADEGARQGARARGRGSASTPRAASTYCETGVSIVVYPENVWYGRVTLGGRRGDRRRAPRGRRAGRAAGALGRRAQAGKASLNGSAATSTRTPGARHEHADRAPERVRGPSRGRWAAERRRQDARRDVTGGLAADGLGERGGSVEELRGKHSDQHLARLAEVLLLRDDFLPAVTALRVRDRARSLARLLRQDVLVEVDPEARTTGLDAKNLGAPPR